MNEGCELHRVDNVITVVRLECGWMALGKCLEDGESLTDQVETTWILDCMKYMMDQCVCITFRTCLISWEAQCTPYSWG